MSAPHALSAPPGRSYATAILTGGIPVQSQPSTEAGLSDRAQLIALLSEAVRCPTAATAIVAQSPPVPSAIAAQYPPLPAEGPLLLTVSQAAARLQVSRTKVY